MNLTSKEDRKVLLKADKEEIVEFLSAKLKDAMTDVFLLTKISAQNIVSIINYIKARDEIDE